MRCPRWCAHQHLLFFTLLVNVHKAHAAPRLLALLRFCARADHPTPADIQRRPHALHTEHGCRGRGASWDGTPVTAWLCLATCCLHNTAARTALAAHLRDAGFPTRDAAGFTASAVPFHSSLATAGSPYLPHPAPPWEPTFPNTRHLRHYHCCPPTSTATYTAPRCARARCAHCAATTTLTNARHFYPHTTAHSCATARDAARGTAACTTFCR